MNPLRFSAPLAIFSLAGLFASCEKSSQEVPSGEMPAPVVTEEVSLPTEVSFNEHIQPILSEYCYHCHGPDEGTRLPEDEPLRLDRPEDAFMVRASGQTVIVKGDPSASKLVELIRHKDPEVMMPPPESHKTMKAREIALIERWIEQGAEYESHWAFAPIERPDVPEEGADWSANPIDRFVFAKMAEAGLKPNEPEDPKRFHRRLTLDTTGLLPQPEETAAFVKAYQENPEAAVQAEAERLLATTASAEHFARHWLDAARYADTHGIHIDNYRAIWPYRDWVIRAFEANMPWDQFTIEQIAGDLLPNRTLDQQVATGFSRCLPTTGEGGAIKEEYEAIYAMDRVDTTSAVWLGLTASCAACHDHKFDPLSTREFYSLTAFFRNNTMSAMDRNEAEHPPAIFVPLPGDRDRFATITKKLNALEKKLAVRRKAARPDYERWLPNAVIHGAQEIDSTLLLHLPLLKAEGSLQGMADGAPREWSSAVPTIDGPFGMAAVVSDTAVELGDVASLSSADQVTYGGFIRVEGKPTGAVIARMDGRESHFGWSVELQGGRVVARIVDSNKPSFKAVASKPLKSGKWHHVVIAFDSKGRGNKALSIHIDGTRQKGFKREKPDEKVEGVSVRLGAQTDSASHLKGQIALQDFRFYRGLLSPAEFRDLAESSLLSHVLGLPGKQRTPEQTESLFGYYIENVDAPTRALREQMAPLQSEEVDIRDRGSMSLVMEEKKNSEPFAHVLTRGVYSDKGEKVLADTPAVLPPMPADAPKNRLGLAQWLVDPANPLPARVTMNRTWYYFFGTGIVETTEDFGIMGARPSHPKLLDWLASEFISNKWNYREMLKQMVTSATYRQSGDVTAEKLEADPANVLLSRGPRNRLDAEQIRDMALAASGSLVNQVGGPPVKPYQPEGIWEAVAMSQSNTRHYQQDEGDSLYRRSIYTFWKRTAPPASMEILDAPTREVTCVRRDRTNTPLQALVLLNDPQLVEASRVLAAAAMENAQADDARLDYITLRLLSRVLEAEERSVVKETFSNALATYREDPEAAKALIATGASPVPTKFDPAELATWTLISSQIFNLDETVTR